MFKEWANYLLGSVFATEEATLAGVENTKLRFTSRNNEDGWILVDTDAGGRSDSGSVGSVDDRLEEFTQLQPITRTRSSSTSSLPCATNMEESWFITPPPCFTSTGPICMRTSPLENLLIEHPSMSVYHIHQRRHLVENGQVSSASSHCSENPEDFEDVIVDRVELPPAAVRRTPLNPLLLMQQQHKKHILGRKVQKAKACENIKRRQLERNNKAREIKGRNRRQRRGERSQGATRSCVSNNRKC